MQGEAADYYMLLRMIGPIKVSGDRFRCVFVVFLYVAKVLSESVETVKPEACVITDNINSLTMINFNTEEYITLARLNYRVRKTLESWHTAKSVGADNNWNPLPIQYSILL